MQMLPSAVNIHRQSNKYQYMFVESLYITCDQLRSEWNFDWPSKIIVDMKHFFGDGDANL